MAPLGITVFAVVSLFNFVDRPIRDFLYNHTGGKPLNPGDPEGIKVWGIGLIVTLLIILVTGAIASNFVLKSVLSWFEASLDRIPGVRTLYSGVKQLIAPLADEHAGTFQKVVMIEFPDANNYSLGFLIKPNAAISPKGEPLSAVLVPTNHLHLGNVVLCPNHRIHSVDLSAEEGLKFLVSMGSALDRKLVLGAGQTEFTPIPGSIPTPDRKS